VAAPTAGIQYLSQDLIAISERNEERCCVKLAGRITIDSSPDLRLLLLRKLGSIARPVFAVDLGEVTYMDTSGLAVLVEFLKAARQSSKRFQLSGLRERPRYLLEATHVLHLAKVGLFVMIIAIVLIVTIYYVGNEQWGRHLTP
jgi:anti-sigma B factor antagonist